MKAAAGALLAALTPSLLAQTPAPAPTPAQPPAPAEDVWVPRPIVELVALDKVSARPTRLTGKIGEQLHYGSLTIVATACEVRPPDASPDAAAFLRITDSRPGASPFAGWMLLRAPALSVYEHPVYDIRLAGCRAG